MDLFGDHYQGVVHLRNGEVAHLMLQKDGDSVHLRYESGWNVEYRLDGTRVSAGRIIYHCGREEIVVGCPERDVIRFEPMTWEEAKATYPNVTYGIHP